MNRGLLYKWFTIDYSIIIYRNSNLSIELRITFAKVILNLIPPSMDGWGHAAEEVDSDHGHLVSVHMSLDHRCPKAHFHLSNLRRLSDQSNHRGLLVGIARRLGRDYFKKNINIFKNCQNWMRILCNRLANASQPRKSSFKNTNRLLSYKTKRRYFLVEHFLMFRQVTLPICLEGRDNRWSWGIG